MTAIRAWVSVFVALSIAACGGGGGGSNNPPPPTPPPPVDTTPPATSITANPADPSNSSDASFSFTSSEPGSSFQCSIDGGALATCASPATYSGLAEGAHTFSVEATDAAGNTDATPASFGWSIDVTPPDTALTAAPASPTNSTTATLEFTSSEPGSTFQCSLDGAAFSICASPATYPGLAQGMHSVDVRAVDAAGNIDPTPAMQSWVIDLTPPDTLINSSPANPTNQTAATFGFVATEAGSFFQCSLDGSPFINCVSGSTYPALGEGPHSFSVRATDAANNSDPTPAVFNWEVDLTPPNTVISAAPTDPSNSASATFIFDATETGSAFTCSLDGGAFSSCASPANYSGLAEGPHTFNVIATDSAGNSDPTPATHDWTVDTTPPETTISSTPADPTNQTTAQFVFDSNEAGSIFECSLDGGATSACVSPRSFTGLAEGAHTFSVQATDLAGNTDATPASFDWTVDLTPPVVTVPAGIVVVAVDANGTPASDVAIQQFLAAATALDTLDGDVSGGITNDAPTVFPLGISTVTFSATDAAGNTGSNTSTVEVIPADVDPPDMASITINNNAQYATSVTELTARLIAMDNVGVTDYLITEHNATDPMNVVPPYLDPLSSDGRWISVDETDILDLTLQVPLVQTYNLGDTVELCAWFMDAQQNISARVCDAITFGNDWESGIGNWSADNGLWQVGTPTTVGPASCFSGTQCAGTVLDGNYPPTTDSRLISASVILPTVAGTDELHLRFQQWFGMGGNDAGFVQVSVFDPLTSSWGPWTTEGTAITDSSGGWSLKDVDLTAYAGATIRVGFWHTADGSSISVGPGWYLDDIVLVRTTPQFTGDFESGWDGWGAGNGLWQVGAPSAVGPAACFAGTQCAGTVLDGNYPAGTDSRLVSASVLLPTVAGADEVHLRFQQWFNLGGNDAGFVQVSVFDAVTGTWGAWTTEDAGITNSSGGWSLKDVDLTAYAGETIRIGLFHTADGSSISLGNGWYVDDAVIVQTTPQFSGDFEAGWDDWGADNGLWQVGAPSSVGPAACFAGTQCAGTVLDGNYPAGTDSRLVSASVLLPTVAGADEVHLRFQQWFNLGGNDAGFVQVSVFDAVTGTWGAWTTEDAGITNSSGGWSLKDVDLTAYAGETIRIGLFHTADGSSISLGNGWYVDDAVIVQTTPQFSGDFEAGWDDWGADNGLWQVGAPSSVGPAACFAGTQCAGTVLDGNYPAGTDSRLVSASVLLPTVAGADEVHLRFQQWFNLGGNDAGFVQVSVFDAMTGTWGAWISEGTSVTASSGGWSLKDVDLTAYAGETVRVGIYHTADGSSISLGNGWYVDDVVIVVF